MLKRYLIQSKISYVMLRPVNVYGWMESGKTTLSLKIASRIEEIIGDGAITIMGRRQSDVLDYIENNKDVIKGNSYIVMIYDDAGRYYLSREAMTRDRKEEVKDFLELRHIFEKMGLERAVIVPIFNIQYYSLLEKTMRNTPCAIWKSMVITDSSDRRELALSLGKYYHVLKVITRAIYIDNYVFTRSQLPHGSRYSRLYDWLYTYLLERGARRMDDGLVIDRDIAKRFVVSVLLGEPSLMDFGNEINKPKNLVEVKPSGEPRLGEKERVLYYTIMLAKRLGLSFNKYREIMREIGLSFTDTEASKIWQST